MDGCHNFITTHNGEVVCDFMDSNLGVADNVEWVVRQ
jgi:hypothetical protein